MVQAMLKYDSASREVRLTVDRDYKAGKRSHDIVHNVTMYSMYTMYIMYTMYTMHSPTSWTTV